MLHNIYKIDDQLLMQDGIMQSDLETVEQARELTELVHIVDDYLDM